MIFTSMPHGTSVKAMPELVSTGLKIIDLSADYRLKDPKDYPEWYGWDHPHPDLLSKFVLGIPELHRQRIRESNLVACPGCMAVTSILALAPVVKEKLIDNDRIIVDAKIGSSGAGIKPTVATHHSERFGVVRVYKPVGHRHTAEIEQELSLLANGKVTVSFSPHAVNMVRGILCTIHTFPRGELSSPVLWKAYRGLYQSEPFVRLVKDKKGLYRYPDPKIIVGSNYCDVGFEVDEHASRLILFSATDNLMKGAAGSAVQCMNIMCGFAETEGLTLPGFHPM
jgi:N-acetyl-gamma-glutamyl-phosphate/LysW-gamma-L-alpha-aminoadipyl-6-phosphate reductase